MIKKALYLLTFITISIGTYFAAITIYKKILRHHSVIVHCATSINKQAITEITNYCTKNASLLNIQEWTNDLRKQFPIVNTIKLQKNMDKSLEIFIDAHSCKALLNNEMCVSHNGSHYPIQQFATELITQIPSITSTETSKSFNQFLQTIDENILKNYKIIWHSPYEIYLTPSHKKIFHIRTCVDNLPTKKLRSIFYLLAPQIPKNGILDSRFKGQIIVCSNRGKVNGKGIFR